MTLAVLDYSGLYTGDNQGTRNGGNYQLSCTRILNSELRVKFSSNFKFLKIKRSRVKSKSNFEPFDVKESDLSLT